MHVGPAVATLNVLLVAALCVATLFASMPTSRWLYGWPREKATVRLVLRAAALLEVALGLVIAALLIAGVRPA